MNQPKEDSKVLGFDGDEHDVPNHDSDDVHVGVDQALVSKVPDTAPEVGQAEVVPPQNDPPATQTPQVDEASLRLNTFRAMIDDAAHDLQAHQTKKVDTPSKRSCIFCRCFRVFFDPAC